MADEVFAFLAKQSAKAQGCTCEPDITRNAKKSKKAGMTVMDVAHDDWCPMCEHGMQWIITKAHQGFN